MSRNKCTLTSEGSSQILLFTPVYRKIDRRTRWCVSLIDLGVPEEESWKKVNIFLEPQTRRITPLRFVTSPFFYIFLTGLGYYSGTENTR